jgi:hypothetical protein
MGGRWPMVSELDDHPSLVYIDVTQHSVSTPDLSLWTPEIQSGASDLPPIPALSGCYLSAVADPSSLSQQEQ